ncbi:hypothetical protein ACS765_10895 [Yersinia enterocolitica]|uniref:hypothetical protein n=1 Tax=Yersinia enterocolitica TaxID=630 RepID=UPI003B65E68C
MSVTNNTAFEIFSKGVKKQVDEDGVINWFDLSWGRGVAFKQLNLHEGSKVNMTNHFQELAKSLIYRECFPNIHKTLIYLSTIKIMEYSFEILKVAPHIVNINNEVIIYIVEYAVRKYSLDRACAIEKALKEMLGVLILNNILHPRVNVWSVRLRKNSYLPMRNIPAENGVKKKLPEDEVIDFTGRVFYSNCKSERDIFTSAVIALLLCAPTRISEIMSLEVDCEVEGKDSSGNLSYGIRYYCAKGYGESIKWIPSNMRPVAKLAIQRLKILSKSARLIVSIREQGEFRFYEKLGVNPNETSFCKQFYNLINVENKDGLNIYSKEILARIESESISAKELWEEIVKYEQSRDSWSSSNKAIKLSDQLLLLNKDQLHMKKGTDLFKAFPATIKMFHADFKARSGTGKDNALNFFQRHKSIQPEGMKEVFRSHQPRHLLNTLVQRSILSDIEIAFWSGRRNIAQNQVYDNRSAEELREDERRVLYADEIISDVSAKFEIISKIRAYLESLNRTCELYYSEIDLRSQNMFKKEIDDINKNINHLINYYTREVDNE